MSIEKLERVCRRLRHSPPAGTKHRKDITIAIMREIGTDERTVRKNIRALKTLGWLTEPKRDHYELTGEDLR